ncbi:MAG: radical SAM protein, partial [Planctomycetia bacterium]|nr:radical SAM protein [Planctomycetia bacterium]
GKLNDAQFGSRMRGQGAFAAMIDALFQAGCRRERLNVDPLRLSTEAFERPEPGGTQLRLFD